MPGRQAKILAEPIIYRALRAISSRDGRLRDTAILMLSIRAGLRAGEIAGLDWEMVMDPRGRLDHCLALPDRIAKKGSGRRVPLHPELRQTLLALVRTGIKSGPVILSRRGVRMQPNSIVNWFVALFAEIGAEGCSSHSGRRTFITHAARNAHKAGASLRDVQLLAGHRSIQVTQGYIEGDSDAQRRLVRSL
jgi:integrase